MRTCRSLPDGYVLSGTIRLRGNRKLWLVLLLLSLPWAVVSTVGIGWFASLVRPQGWTLTFSGTWLSLAGIAATAAATIVLHEAVHGVLLWGYTRARPVFGFRGWYAYADSPGWYFSRRPTVVTGLAPLVVLTAIGLPLVAVLPSAVSMFVLMGLFINAVAAIGDLYIVVVALRIRGPVYFGDAPGARPGEAASWFLPGTSAGTVTSCLPGPLLL